MTVVEPFMSTIAGGGSMLIHLRRRGETAAVDFNVEAPRACHEHCYALSEGTATDLFPWRRVVDDANVLGAKAVAVPGSVAGLCLALERFGTMELADVMAPAIELAERGFVPDWYVGLTTAIHADQLAAFPETARAYLRDGRYIYRPPSTAEGDLLRQPDLACSLRLIAQGGPDVFYRGAIADAIQDAMAAAGGFLTKQDLATYEPRIEPPLTGRYRRLEVALMPGATGGISALEVLNILAQFPSARVGHATASGLHLRAEAIRRAFADRLQYLADPRHVKAPWDGLASASYAAAVAATIKPGGPRGGAAAADPWAFEAEGDTSGRAGRRPRATPERRAVGGRQGGAATDCTTHIGVVDRQRNMVSLTHTAVSLFGSRMVAPDTGILLSNGMIWFDPEPGRPNSVAAGKRALVNMVPLLAFRRGEPYLTLGAPGGRKIISVVPQVFSNMVDAGDSLQAATEAPRLHTEGAEVLVSASAGSTRLEALRRMRHPVVVKEESYGTFFFARPVAIRIGSNGLEAGLDPLSDASAAGF
jgi:gamma-glutamyltranspeptidase/glutathione hydrolase